MLNGTSTLEKLCAFANNHIHFARLLEESVDGLSDDLTSLQAEKLSKAFFSVTKQYREQAPLAVSKLKTFLHFIFTCVALRIRGGLVITNVVLLLHISGHWNDMCGRSEGNLETRFVQIGLGVFIQSRHKCTVCCHELLFRLNDSLSPRLFQIQPIGFHFSFTFIFLDLDLLTWLSSDNSKFIGIVLQFAAESISETYVELLLTTGVQVRLQFFRYSKNYCDPIFLMRMLSLLHHHRRLLLVSSNELKMIFM